MVCTGRGNLRDDDSIPALRTVAFQPELSAEWEIGISSGGSLRLKNIYDFYRGVYGWLCMIRDSSDF